MLYAWKLLEKQVVVVVMMKIYMSFLGTEEQLFCLLSYNIFVFPL